MAAAIGAGFVALMSLLSPLLHRAALPAHRAAARPGPVGRGPRPRPPRSGVQADDVEGQRRERAHDGGQRLRLRGSARSRHIVLFDTLLRDFPRDQVRMVVAHELAHVARRHVLKGSAWGAALAVPGCLLVFAIVGWRTGFGQASPDAAGLDLVLRRLAIAAGRRGARDRPRARRSAQLGEPGLRARGRLGAR